MIFKHLLVAGKSILLILLINANLWAAPNEGVMPLDQASPKASSEIAKNDVEPNKPSDAKEAVLTPAQLGAQQVTAEELIDLVTTLPDLVLIDSRIEDDRGQGYIEGSKSLSDEKTNCDSLASLIPTTETPVIFYCNGIRCHRSGNAVNIATACGYQKIYWFRGGFEEWENKELPYIK